MTITNDTVQIATIFGFVVALFVLYRVLISAKDAAIERKNAEISSPRTSFRKKDRL
jgi:hypothetical protein